MSWYEDGPTVDNGGLAPFPTSDLDDELGYDANHNDPSQYCRHGSFIGSWAGPDYLCQACEMGYDRQITVTSWEATFPEPNFGYPVHIAYFRTKAEADKWLAHLRSVEAEHGVFWPGATIEKRTEKVWCE